MAYFDAAEGEVVVRVVYDGAGTAGKTTNLRALHTAFLNRSDDGLIVPEETRSGRTLYFDWLELKAGHIDRWPLRCQVLSVPGQLVYANRRFRLLDQIDAVVFVCDSTPTGLPAGRVAAAFLKRAMTQAPDQDVPIILQANKQDLPDAIPAEEVAERLGIDFETIVPASATSEDGVRWTLIRALDAARARLRRRFGATPPPELPPATQSADELLQVMRSSDAEESEELVDALEHALREVPS